MALLTITTLVVAVYGFVTRRYDRALALGGATPAGVALAVGETPVPTFYAIALGAPLLLLVDALWRNRQQAAGLALPARQSVPGVGLLVAFLVWSAAVTLISPFLFDGLTTAMVDARKLTAGVVTTSNIAQLTYLLLGIAVVVLLARMASVGPEIIGLSVGIAITLSAWRLISTWTGLPFPEGVFDNSPTMVFIDTAPGGALRFRGIFSEPSALAGSALVAAVYGVSRAVRVRGWRRAGCLVLAAVSVVLGLLSTSTTFVIAGVTIVIVAIIAFVASFLARRTRFGAGIAVLMCGLAVAAVWYLPQLTVSISDVVQDKVLTSSFTERTGTDALSYRIFFDTWGLGVGLGAGRASSFVPTLLGSVGVVGTILFVLAVSAIVARSINVLPYRPVLWALTALFVTKVIAGPDLSDPTGMMWMCLGALAHAGLQTRRDVDGRYSPVSAVSAASPVTARVRSARARRAG